MTAEEREMFDDLVAAIEANHERVVGKVHEPFQTSLADDPPATGDAADGDPSAAETAVDGTGSAAEVAAATADDAVTEPPADGRDSRGSTAADASVPDETRPQGEAVAEAEREQNGSGPTDHADEVPPDGFVRVRIVEDVPGFVGTDGVEYDPSPDDVVTLPEENAEALCARDAAEEVAADEVGSE